jgi:hypothetical protein
MYLLRLGDKELEREGYLSEEYSVVIDSTKARIRSILVDSNGE